MVSKNTDAPSALSEMHKSLLADSKTHARFWSKVAVVDSTECWEWLGYKNLGGYGRFRKDGKIISAHRCAYTLLIGPIQEGLEIDHLCKNRACQNPKHMEPVTRLENVRRGLGWVYWREKTHCRNGHPYDLANTRRTKTGRRCKACRRMWRIKWANKVGGKALNIIAEARLEGAPMVKLTERALEDKLPF